jgi:hypothetical protein
LQTFKNRPCFADVGQISTSMVNTHLLCRMIVYSFNFTLAKNQKTCCRNLALKKTEAAAR